MKSLEEIKTALIEHKQIFFEQFHVTKIGIFGSYIRQEQTEDSDLDILVEFEPNAQFGLFTFCKLENYMTEIAGVKVDLVMKDNLKPKIGQEILSQVVYI
ncbi:MAG: hypothetical protein N5P05_004117 (plasmid) [Chroococcopsis gigantea SAG 12.99]|jgi:predicted nucleotidyltransferase|nr:hypothetical protein [Chroococcopsis gigantea SAG 12.99]